MIICYSNKEIIGWSFLHKYNTAYQVAIFVPSAFRRKGIGSALIKKAKEISSRYNRNLYADHWDDTASLFFDSQNIPDQLWNWA